MTCARNKGYCHGVRALYEIRVGLVILENFLLLHLYYLPLKSRGRDVGPPMLFFNIVTFHRGKKITFIYIS